MTMTTDDRDHEETEQPQDIWQLLEKPAEEVEDVADLYHWSTNYDPGKGPFTLFLDMIGWTEDEFGEDFTLYDFSSRSLGYVELDKLADALKQYADRPQDVRDFVNLLMVFERES